VGLVGLPLHLHEFVKAVCHKWILSSLDDLGPHRLCPLLTQPLVQRTILRP
jgi:hypothetical protein